MRDIPRYEPERLHSKADRAEDRALQGWNPSADSVGRDCRERKFAPAFFKAILARSAKSQGFGDGVPGFKGDRVADQLVGHIR
jgi:hypothetical protein